MARNTTPKQKVMFSFRDLNAREVLLAGDFTGWADAPLQMKRDRKGTWKKSVNLATGRYEYRLVVDGVWQDDPNCPDRQPNDFGGENCVCIVPALEAPAPVERERVPV